MIRPVYVVTTARGARARETRQLAGLLAARLVYLLALLGHVLVLLLGAVDALVSALVGVPLMAAAARRFGHVVRETWEEEL